MITKLVGGEAVGMARNNSNGTATTTNSGAAASFDPGGDDGCVESEDDLGADKGANGNASEFVAKETSTSIGSPEEWKEHDLNADSGVVGPGEKSLAASLGDLISPLHQITKLSKTSKLPLLFERASNSWWHPKFDSVVLEDQYWKSTFPRIIKRLQLGLVYLLVLALGLSVYFPSVRTPTWPAFLGFGLGMVTLVVLVLLLSVTEPFQKHCYKICTTVSLVLCSSCLWATTAGLEKYDLSPSGLFAVYVEMILLLYAIVPLPLYATLLIGVVYSCLFETLLCIALPERWNVASVVFVNILVHICIHVLGIHILITTQVRMRDTFMKVGQSLMVKKQLVTEKSLKEKMIHSVMPPKVADWLMREGHAEDDTNDLKSGPIGPGGGPAGKAVIDKGTKNHHRKKSFFAGGVDAWSSDDDNYVDDSESGSMVRKISSPRSSNQGDLRTIFRPFNMNAMDDVSILFADIVGFTKMSSNKTASQLVGLLNDLFGRFDNLCAQCRCEKISTLGDCYYCVSGCPEPTPSHARNCVEMGLAMISAIREFDEDRHESVNMRVGIHTGTVLCGIVGKRRFKFDVWSNDVTLANKMESTGKPGTVHISEKTYVFLKDQYFVQEGEPIGDLKTYFISGRATPGPDIVSTRKTRNFKAGGSGPGSVITARAGENSLLMSQLTSHRGSPKRGVASHLEVSTNGDGMHSKKLRIGSLQRRLKSESAIAGDGSKSNISSKTSPPKSSKGFYNPKVVLERKFSQKRSNTEENKPVAASWDKNDQNGSTHSVDRSKVLGAGGSGEIVISTSQQGSTFPVNGDQQLNSSLLSRRCSHSLPILQCDNDFSTILSQSEDHELLNSAVLGLNTFSNMSDAIDKDGVDFVGGGISRDTSAARRGVGSGKNWFKRLGVMCVMSRSSQRRSFMHGEQGYTSNDDTMKSRLSRLRAQSDIAMIRCIKEDPSHHTFFTHPPLWSGSLFFKDYQVEKEYRRSAWRPRPAERRIHLENNFGAEYKRSRKIWTPSIFNAYFDLFFSGVSFIVVSLAAFLHYPITWAWLSHFTAAASYYALLVYVFIRNMILQSRHHFRRGTFITRLYSWCRSWIPSHVFGLLLNGLPIAAVFVNFNCDATLKGTDRDFYLQLVYVGLLHFCNLSALNHLTKSVLASVCAIAVIFLYSPLFCGGSPIHTLSSTSTTCEDIAETMVMDSVNLCVNSTSGESSADSSAKLVDSSLLFGETILSILMLLALVWVLNRESEMAYRISFHCSQLSARDRRKIQNLKNQADWLLHNIIPRHVSESLKKSAGYSENHHEVGIIFASLVNFNELYDESYMGGKEYLRVLNELISDFDEILDMQQFRNVEKIKTIGSTFMAASGMNPYIRQENTHKWQHIRELMEFVLALQKSVGEFNQSLIEFDLILRVGFNFGDVTAGVIGTTKLYYDIWSDAVNIASRMESTGVDGRVQVSEKCMNVLSEWYVFELRGSIFVKGKDNMTTYLLVDRKPDASVSAVCT